MAAITEWARDASPCRRKVQWGLGDTASQLWACLAWEGCVPALGSLTHPRKPVPPILEAELL